MSSTLCPSKIQHHKNLKKTHNCSLCGDSYHTIKNCQDSTIRQLDIACSINAQTLTEEEFKNWLFPTKVILLKALCFRYELAGTMKEMPSKMVTIAKISNFHYWERNFEEMIRQVNEAHALQRELIAAAASVSTASIPIIQKIYLNVLETAQEYSDPCPCCYEEESDKRFTYNCNHIFCTDCLTGTIQSAADKELSCSICRAKVATINVNTQKESDIIRDILTNH
jgi:hypothetical protein